MARLSRRSLFAGVAALPALVPAMVAARPYATGGVMKAKAFTIGEGGAEAILPLRRNGAWKIEWPRAVVTRPVRICDWRIGHRNDEPAADDIDDRAFGWEG